MEVTALYIHHSWAVRCQARGTNNGRKLRNVRNTRVGTNFVLIKKSFFLLLNVTNYVRANVSAAQTVQEIQLV